MRFLEKGKKKQGLAPLWNQPYFFYLLKMFCGDGGNITDASPRRPSNPHLFPLHLALKEAHLL